MAMTNELLTTPENSSKTSLHQTPLIQFPVIDEILSSHE
jgi:hypothetical protein